MNQRVFELLILTFGVLFALVFFTIVLPPLIESGDVAGAFAAGFVNPYSTGYSVDAILCAFILITWMLYERSSLNIRHGWVVIPLSFAPGVATAFAVYLLLRTRQLGK